MVYKECRLSLNGKGKSCDLLGVGSVARHKRIRGEEKKIEEKEVMLSARSMQDFARSRKGRWVT